MVEPKKKSRKLQKKKPKPKVVKGRRKIKERSQPRNNPKKKRTKWIYSVRTMRKIR